MDLANRSLRSSAYNIAVSGVQTVILFFRSILLARLLDPEIFGIYTFAASFVLITRALPRFGMGSALLHRAEESEGEEALKVHFTLNLFFGFIWFILLGGVGGLVFTGQIRTALWVIAGAEFIKIIAGTGRLLLIRRVIFRRIAMINLVTTLATTFGAILLAWRGYGLWSLVATDLISALVIVFGFYIYHPVWRPHIGWNPQVVRYFLQFGYKSLAANLLLQALDRLDDLWTGFALGDNPLGYYSRAYTFATFPRRILAAPLNSVASGTYAELKGKPRRLSQAFFRVNAFLIRSGFLFAGLLALIAPEFIRIVLGVKWLPMLTAFRLMLIYTMLDPIKVTIAGLFVAVGRPEKTVQARAVQLVVLIAGLFVLGPRWGIAGVALAVDGMLVIGIALLLWQARVYVQFSLIRLFAVPTFALIVGMASARAAILLPNILGSPWRTGGIKIAVFLPLYALTLLLFERNQLIEILQTFQRYILNRNPQPPSPPGL